MRMLIAFLVAAALLVAGSASAQIRSDLYIVLFGTNSSASGGGPLPCTTALLAQTGTKILVNTGSTLCVQ